MKAAPKTHSEAYAANTNGYRDRFEAFAKACAETRDSDWYAQYMAQHAPKEVAPAREP